MTVRQAPLDEAPAPASLRWQFKREDNDDDLTEPQQEFAARCQEWIREALTGNWLAWAA